MSTEGVFQQITDALISGSEPAAIRLTRQALADGIDPLEIINKGFQPGLDIIGEEYETGSCFVPELILAGRIMQTGMRILERELKRRAQTPTIIGKVVLGTVAGDVHTIGKDLVGTMLNLNGFEVYDLGFNVPTAVFIEKLQAVEAQILALSALLTTTRHVQKEIIEALQNAGLREQVKVIIGGASTSQRWADSIGADGYAENASNAVGLCRHLIKTDV